MVYIWWGIYGGVCTVFVRVLKGNIKLQFEGGQRFETVITTGIMSLERDHDCVWGSRGWGLRGWGSRGFTYLQDILRIVVNSS